MHPSLYLNCLFSTLANDVTQIIIGSQTDLRTFIIFANVHPERSVLLKGSVILKPDFVYIFCHRFKCIVSKYFIIRSIFQLILVYKEDTRGSVIAAQDN